MDERNNILKYHQPVLKISRKMLGIIFIVYFTFKQIDILHIKCFMRA